MKKLPSCMLLSSAAFAIAGTIALSRVAPRPDPFPLFFPLAWDLIMVGIGLGVIFRCDCARRAGLAWGVFCIFASLVIGAIALGWLWPQGTEPLGRPRLVFMCLTVAFGLIFGIWQLFALNSPEVRAWTDPDHRLDPGTHSQPHHG